MQDTMIVDGLWDVYNQYHMGITAENVARENDITREQQDELAMGSQQRRRLRRTQASSRMKSFPW